MSKPANEPVVQHPPVNADMTPVPAAEVAQQSSVVFKPTIGQLVSLFAAGFVFICFFLPWAGLLINGSGFDLATSSIARQLIPTVPALLLVPIVMLVAVVAVIGRKSFALSNRNISTILIVSGVLVIIVMLYHAMATQRVVTLLFGFYGALLGSFLVTIGGGIDLFYKGDKTVLSEVSIPTDTLRAYTMVFALIIIWLYFHFSTGHIFLEPRNFSNLMRQTSVTGVLAVGMLMIIVTGQIDLSVGSLVGLAGGAAAIMQGLDHGWGLVPSLAAGIAIALAIGAVQGALTAYLNIPAFIVTLGGLLAWRGVILGWTGGETVPLRIPAFKSIGQDYVGPMIGWVLAALAVAAIVWLTLSRNRARKRHGQGVPGLVPTLARIVLPAAVVVWFIYMMNSYEIAPGRFAGIPIPVIILLAVALGGAFLTQNTTFGRYLYAIGGNPDAARLSGISIRKHLLAVFCLMGALAGVASLIYTARVGSASPDAGQLLELDAIAACVIGGTSLMGGRGTVFGAIIGALIMSSLDNGMSLKNVAPYTQNIIKGAILVAAVGLDMAGRKRG